MDELKIAAGIICSAILSKILTGQADLNDGPEKTVAGYWKIYNALKNSNDNPDKKKS